MIYLIAAMTEAGVIGKDNGLPWDIPADMERFRDLTVGNAVVMGRKTFVSIGRALPDRNNVVLTKTLAGAARQKGCLTSPNIDAMISQRAYFEDRGKDIFIIGGAEIYKQFMGLADGIYLTVIHQHFEGDTYFPEIPADQYDIESAEAHPGLTFLKYTRIKPVGQ